MLPTTFPKDLWWKSCLSTRWTNIRRVLVSIIQPTQSDWGGVNISSLNQTSICISGFSCQQNQLLDLFLTRSSTTLFFLVTGGYFTTTKSFSRNIKTDLILLNFETPDRDQATNLPWRKNLTRTEHSAGWGHSSKKDNSPLLTLTASQLLVLSRCVDLCQMHEHFPSDIQGLLPLKAHLRIVMLGSLLA